jgi:hypothetical protein
VAVTEIKNTTNMRVHVNMTTVSSKNEKNTQNYSQSKRKTALRSA